MNNNSQIRRLVDPFMKMKIKPRLLVQKTDIYSCVDHQFCFCKDCLVLDKNSRNKHEASSDDDDEKLYMQCSPSLVRIINIISDNCLCLFTYV